MQSANFLVCLHQYDLLSLSELVNDINIHLHILQQRVYFFLYFLDPEGPTSYFKAALLTFYVILHI